MNNDGLDRIVIGKLFELLDHGLRLDDHTFQVNHGNLVTKAAEFPSVAATHRHNHYRGNRKEKDKKYARTEQHPNPCAGFSSIVHRWISVAPLPAPRK